MNIMSRGSGLLIPVLLVALSAETALSITAFGIEGGLSREQPPPRPEQIWDNPQLKPAFGEIPISSILTPVGRVTYLHCTVNHLGSRVVTWLRKRDAHVLTTGLYSYTSDQRFTALHTEGSSDWLLKITSPQIRDSGTYECQVSTEPKISKAFNLTVIEPMAVIDGPTNRHMSAGNTLNLTCFTSAEAETPKYYYWYHNDRVIQYTSNDNKQNKGSETHHRTVASRQYDYNEVYDSSTNSLDHSKKKNRPYHRAVSSLVIRNVGGDNSGNYSCAPENASPATVTVYVLRAGEQSAAMQHGENNSSDNHGSKYLLTLTLIALLSR